ncbi:alkylhydroperoxidase AhpD family core domain-containing protein [Faunimonas pinastri]|uniref:Alkylhydroperoxidase AhpD family core domain-containing protein n=1 Tax=Faunimonas pinastri TaxID=1855383 RepID=A0A1H9LDA0_9HYPH|nr:carboxymuconolactone decarboxylase family protein [Faunimonas pinastri]SER08913.1 alkylhydroperoxidase AhpD family core domain-containing protein [Faunimonas pinastri]
MSHAANVDYETFASTAPGIEAGLLALGKAVDASGLEKQLTELVKLRVSQINGCAFCVQHHLNIARKIGVAAAKLDLLAAWRDAGLFSDREKAALEWAELLTALPSASPPEDAFGRLRLHVSEAEAIFLTAAIATINAWNRLGVGLRFAPVFPGS